MSIWEEGMKRLGMAAVLLVALGALSACGGGKQTTEVKTTTTGQELTDLKAALDSGAISQKEYDKKREEILEEG